MELTSPAWNPGQRIPSRYSCQGEDLSPPLVVAGTPPGTLEFALICEDPDAPVGTWVHWVIYGVPGNATGLPEGVPRTPELPNGSRQGKNSWGRPGYGGPCPPPGKPHRYFFRIFALGEKIQLRPGATVEELRRAIQGRDLGDAELMGTYSR